MFIAFMFTVWMDEVNQRSDKKRQNWETTKKEPYYWQENIDRQPIWSNNIEMHD